MAEFVKEKLFMRTGTKSSNIKMYSSVYLFTEKIIIEKNIQQNDSGKICRLVLACGSPVVCNSF
jgi:hypothetical protein